MYHIPAPTRCREAGRDASSELLQEVQQQQAPLWSQGLGKPGLVPCRQGLDPHQRFLARASQMERVRAAIAICGAALDPSPPLEPMQQPGEPGALDIERLADRRLRPARISLDEQQYGILRRAYVHRRQRADEVLEDGDLQATQEIAEVSIERAELQPFRLVRRNGRFPISG